MSSQVIINGITAGSLYALVAVGFGIIYSTTRFFNFAHGIVYTTAAYSLYAAHSCLGISSYLSALISIAAATLLGAFLDLGCYRPLRRRGASPLVLLIASLGLYIVIQNSISAIAGDDSKSVRSVVVEEGLEIIGGKITPIQIATIAVAAAAVGCMAVLSRTRVGRQLRCVANDAILARTVGISVDRMYLLAFCFGSALAGIAAVLVSFDSNVWPGMGFNAMMTGVVALIIGGLGRTRGAVFGGLALGLMQSYVGWRFGSDWQDVVVFAILILFLLFRPRGFAGGASS